MTRPPGSGPTPPFPRGCPNVMRTEALKGEPEVGEVQHGALPERLSIGRRAKSGVGSRLFDGEAVGLSNRGEQQDWQ